MIIRFPYLLLALVLLAPATASEPVDLEKYRAASEKKWAKAIDEFDERNKAEKHPDDSILFIGSSSIRLWETIGDDLTPYHAIQRGFGGSRWSDVAIYADRLITPHKFRAAVFFVGNDISGSPIDKTPEEVAALFGYVREVVRKHNPDAQVFYIAVTPTEKRWEAWPKIRAANNAVRKYCQETARTYFIGTESIFLDGDGQPRPEFFVDDRLHLNADGYKQWSAAIKSHLDSVLGGAR